jgi:hypothetical protein
MYCIDTIPSKSRLLMTFEDFANLDFEMFMRDAQAATLQAKGASRHFDILADFSDTMVMPQNIARGSQDIACWFLENGLRRSANVMQSITQRMQIQRVTDRDTKFAYFETHAEAQAWLDE